MLQPVEQLAARRFPGDSIVRGNKSEQTVQAGNAVSCNVAQWLGSRVAAVLWNGALRRTQESAAEGIPPGRRHRQPPR
ncbi:hypothetical protein ACFVAG_07460 [Streptomyces sp. NPDC057644]|uniref:hypothetical protein n=1 Tax=Streptomyces sp. NPDC057644 TaxID=3346191 RepID=UPI0036C3D9E2